MILRWPQNDLKINMFLCNYRIGDWGVRAALALPPNREIDFDCACVCVACVRASERSCVREMIPLWLGAGGEICGGPSVPPVRAPVPIKSVRAPVRIKSSSFSSSDRCFVISLTQCIFLGVGPMRFRVFRACFVVLAWLGRRLAPPGANRRGPLSWSPGFVYASAPVVLV